MKRQVTYIAAVSLIIFAAGASAQMRNQQQAPNSNRTPRQPAMEQRMGRMQGQSGMHEPGMGMMNGNMMRGGGRGGRQAGSPMRGSGDEFYLNLRGRLDLTDDQVEKLRELRIEHVKITCDIETDLQVARLELRDLLDDDTPDMGKIEDRIGTIHDLEAQLETERLRVRFDAQAVLTPEQLEQIQSAPRGRSMMRSDVTE